jgi:hypothetical protein
MKIMNLKSNLKFWKERLSHKQYFTFQRSHTYILPLALSFFSNFGSLIFTFVPFSIYWGDTQLSSSTKIGLVFCKQRYKRFEDEKKKNRFERGGTIFLVKFRSNNNTLFVFNYKNFLFFLFFYFTYIKKSSITKKWLMNLLYLYFVGLLWLKKINILTWIIIKKKIYNHL